MSQAPGPSALQMLIHLTFIITLWGSYYLPSEKTEAQRLKNLSNIPRTLKEVTTQQNISKNTFEDTVINSSPLESIYQDVISVKVYWQKCLWTEVEAGEGKSLRPQCSSDTCEGRAGRKEDWVGRASACSAALGLGQAIRGRTGPVLVSLPWSVTGWEQPRKSDISVWTCSKSHRCGNWRLPANCSFFSGGSLLFFKTPYWGITGIQ